MEIDITDNLNVTCDWCDKVFRVKSQRLKNNSICCSRDCYAKLKKSMAAHNAECCICSKKFHRKQSQLKKSKNVVCSRECFKTLQSKRISGKGNHQYGLIGEMNSSYKSDFRLSNYGYVLVRNVNHPFSNSDGLSFFHRIVMEEYLIGIGKYEYLVEINGNYFLNPGVVVHHKDGNKLNNVIDNLEVMTIEEHSSYHAKEKIKTIERDTYGRLLPTGKILKGNMLRAHSLDAGQDVFSNQDMCIRSRDSSIISTGLVINVPKGHVGLLWSRSGLSVKHKIEVGAGCIDSGFNGEVMVHLYNHGDKDYNVVKGDRIAQLLTIPINYNDYESGMECCASERGSSGFGSTGG